MLSNYPPGLSDHTPDAPWNEPVLPEREFDVTVSQTLSKSISICTDDYIPGACGVDYEPDGEGGYCSSSWHDDDDTSETDWKKAYSENAMNPLEIIGCCEKIAKALLEQGYSRFEGIWLTSLIEDCQGWTEDELEVVED